jgi:hypothetical protein
MEGALPEASLEGLCATLIAADLDLKGGGVWAPVRAYDRDHSAWGWWEAWEEAKVGPLPSGAVGAIATGSWLAWNAATGQYIGFHKREGAEMMAVLQNGGLKPTRVVALDGTESASPFDFEKVREAAVAAGAPM